MGFQVGDASDKVIPKGIILTTASTCEHFRLADRSYQGDKSITCLF